MQIINSPEKLFTESADHLNPTDENLELKEKSDFFNEIQIPKFTVLDKISKESLKKKPKKIVFKDLQIKNSKLACSSPFPVEDLELIAKNDFIEETSPIHNQNLAIQLNF